MLVHVRSLWATTSVFEVCVCVRGPNQYVPGVVR